MEACQRGRSTKAIVVSKVQHLDDVNELLEKDWMIETRRKVVTFPKSLRLDKVTKM